MRRRNTQDEPGLSAPFWMSTYGDMVTNLLVFFVLLFSFSTIDANKWKELVISFTGGTGVIGSGEDISRLPEDIKDLLPEDINLEEAPKQSQQIETTGNPEDIDDFDRLYRQIQSYVEESNLDTQLDLTKSDTEILIRFRDNVIFDSGKADIKPESENILGDIVKVLLNYQNDIDMIRIEGHTDNVPIHTGKYPSNWELSTSRAVEVLRYFIEKHSFDPHKLSAVGYGEYHPVSSNDTSTGRAVNRRVDIVIAKAVGSSTIGKEE
jgi:chemotaxis protein MotB